MRKAAEIIAPDAGSTDFQTRHGSEDTQMRARKLSTVVLVLALFLTALLLLIPVVAAREDMGCKRSCVGCCR